MSLLETEFAALRHTIAIRGTVRTVLLPVTLLGWGGLVTSLLLLGDQPIAALVALTVLAGGFEAIHALHAGVERIGRYVQVYYESGSHGPRWETTALAVGPALPGGGIDPLFTVVFIVATILNLAIALLPRPTRIEVVVVVAFHLLFVLRVVRARVAAARQRAVELESFRAIQAREEHPRSPNH